MPSARQVRLDVDVANRILITARPEALEAILETVVDNALSFSPTGGRVLVRLKASSLF